MAAKMHESLLAHRRPRQDAITDSCYGNAIVARLQISYYTVARAASQPECFDVIPCHYCDTALATVIHTTLPHQPFPPLNTSLTHLPSTQPICIYDSVALIYT